MRQDVELELPSAKSMLKVCIKIASMKLEMDAGKKRLVLPVLDDGNEIENYGEQYPRVGLIDFDGNVVRSQVD